MVEDLVRRRKLEAPDQFDIGLALDSFSLREKHILNSWIKDRIIRHKPLQYILGSQPFCGMDICTRAPILIPRWETEEWYN